MLRTARESPQKTALVEGERSHSYQSLLEDSMEFGIRLRDFGLREGETVGIWLDKSYSLVVALYGTWMAGGVTVPIFEGFRGRQLKGVLEHSQCRCLVSSDARLRTVSSVVLGSVPVVKVGERAVGRVRTVAGSPKARTEALACLFYTSGSTGPQKGVMVSHQNLMAGARIVSQYLKLRAADRILSVLPFSFDYGLNQLLTSVHVGGTLVLNQSPFPIDVCQLLVDEKITGLAGVPPFWLRLLQKESPFGQSSFPYLRYLTNSGGTLPKGAIQEIKRILPKTELFLMYGLTEAFRSTYLPPEECLTRPGSIGKAIPETEIHVVSPEGRICAPGEVGELVHRGPTVALGYWRDPEGSRLRFRPNPFASERGLAERVVYSGDWVKTDEDGYLYFIGRSDELLKTEGHRVHPSEVEMLIFESRLVNEVVVLAEEDPIAGTRLIAHCVPKDRFTFSEADLLRFCRAEMPSYMVPKRVMVHSAFPLTSTGKIDRTRIVS